MAFEKHVKRGVMQNFGPRKTNLRFGGDNEANLIRRAQWVFKYNDLPVPGTSAFEMVVPAGSTILSAQMRILQAFTSTSTTTDLLVGLQDSVGNEIDNDGLITAAHATQTAIALVGSMIDGGTGTPGALVGKSIGGTNGELVVAPTANDLTAGRAIVYIEYMLPYPVQN